MLPAAQWQLVNSPDPPDDWCEVVQRVAQAAPGLANLPDGGLQWGAKLLWQRGIQTEAELRGFLSPDDYAPASPFAFGAEMAQAVERLVTAHQQHEKVAIWGDFDADGVTSTAVLWDGLGQFFSQSDRLSYFIPNRLTESHGLSHHGLETLAAQGVQLIVTCDTGSTNLAEIDHAHQLGMEVIITDHHTLPAERPPVVAIVNPRYLEPQHPLANLSGVAVAYKLVEALYERLPEIPQRPLTYLTDLVAIGLIADLVKLTGDCRYLAQIGIQQLRTQSQASTQAARPGVAKLLELCRRTGDRPTDISFGLGPRINAVSRIHGDASFCVELLTSQDPERCRELALQTELANARRKALQNDVLQQVNRQLEAIDLSTTGILVLADPQWPNGVLGIVAGQLAQTYGKPTVLLTMDEPTGIARGSARSANQIDLYKLVAQQAHLLTSFGGHPFAAGMSLPIENIDLFTDAINRQLRQRPMGEQGPIVQVDLTVSVQDLGRDLFKQLNLLEPCGMGNPAPKLLIKNAWFENTWHQKIKDPASGRKLQYIKASFLLRDDTSEAGFPGVWWGHYKDDLLPGRWDVVVELDFNSFSKKKQPQYGGYEVRLIDIRPAQASKPQTQTTGWLIDQRDSTEVELTNRDLVLSDCPTDWTELRPWWQQAAQRQTPLVLAYPPPSDLDFIAVWKTLLGLAKYFDRTGQSVSHEQLQARLQIGAHSLQQGLQALSLAGFEITRSATGLRFALRAVDQPKDVPNNLHRATAVRDFLRAVREEDFRKQYFYQVPLATAQAVMRQLSPTNPCDDRAEHSPAAVTYKSDRTR
ncbi:MAG: single-stranded-DNA-specific exonuclease RecJ [Cyanobacteria bacterium P01_A01_bin.114]